MNPDTGEFHPIEDGPTGDVLAESGEPVPTDWPRFEVDEVVLIKGIPFRVLRINRSSLVMQPVIGQRPARLLVSALTTGSGFPLGRADLEWLRDVRAGHGP